MNWTRETEEIGVSPTHLHYFIYQTPHQPSGFCIETRWGAGSYHSHNDAQRCLDFWGRHRTDLSDAMSARANDFISKYKRPA